MCRYGRCALFEILPLIFFKYWIHSSAYCKSFIFIFNISCNWLFLFLKSLFSSFYILGLFWKSIFSDSDFSFWDFRSCNVLISLFVFISSVSYILLLLSSKLLLICSSFSIFLSNSVFPNSVVIPSSSSATLSSFLLLLLVLLFLRPVFKLYKLTMVCCFIVFWLLASLISLHNRFVCTGINFFYSAVLLFYP